MPVVASALVAILIFPETVSLASGTEAAPADGGKNRTDMMSSLDSAKTCNDSHGVSGVIFLVCDSLNGGS